MAEESEKNLEEKVTKLHFVVSDDGMYGATYCRNIECGYKLEKDDPHDQCPR